MKRDLGIPDDQGDPNRITPDMIKTSKSDTGTAMDQFGANIVAGPVTNYRMLQQLKAIDDTIDSTAGMTDGDRSRLHNLYRNIRSQVSPQTYEMTGTQFQDLLRTNSPLDRESGNANGNVANIAQKFADATRQGFQAAMSPDDAAQYGDLRYRYRLASTLQDEVNDRQGRSLNMGNVTNAFNAARQNFGEGDPRLARFQREASVTNEAPTPQSQSRIAATLQPTPSAVTAWAVDPTTAAGGMGLATALATLKDLQGAYLRSNFNTQALLDRTLRQPTAAQRLGYGLLGAVPQNY
jgi:hypothetical protein